MRRIVIGVRGVAARLRARVVGWLGRAEERQRGAVAAAAHKEVRVSGPLFIIIMRITRHQMQMLRDHHHCCVYARSVRGGRASSMRP